MNTKQLRFSCTHKRRCAHPLAQGCGYCFPQHTGQQNDAGDTTGVSQHSVCTVEQNINPMDGGDTEDSFSPVIMEVWSSSASEEEEEEQNTSSLVDDVVVEENKCHNSNNNNNNNKDSLCREVTQGTIWQ